MGIVILLGAALFFFIRSQELKELEPAVEQLPALDSASIKTYVEGCIIRVAEEPIRNISRDGGTLLMDNFREYDGVKYRYVCQDKQNYQECVPIILTRQDIEKELEQSIQQRLHECIELERFREQGTAIVEGDMATDVRIGQEDISIKVTYPLEMSLGERRITFSDFGQRINLPLGKLLDLSINIMNSEILAHHDQDEWMLQHGAEVIIEKHRPYPDTVYSLTKIDPLTDDNLTFNFAMQGKETFQDVGAPTPVLRLGGCCHNDYDSTCYANIEEAVCSSKPQTRFEAALDNCNCPGASKYSGPECGSGGCIDCLTTWDYNTQDQSGPTRKHGESWCVYDGPVGDGFDYVGTRHYKHSCFNGIEYVEECRDYREEICTEQIIQGTVPRNKAVCRPNRWQTCASQTERSDCEDTELRDCKWTQELTRSDVPSFGMQRDRHCHPEVPPGFAHWDLGGVQACIAANEWRYCDGANCPDQWVTMLSQYCNFMGDCGNYRNVKDRITTSGYINSDNSPAVESYLRSGLTSTGNDQVLGLRLDTWTGPALTGNEFANPDHEPGDILDEAIAFAEDASTWDPGEFLWEYMTEGEIEIELFNAGICGPWQAPPNTRDCNTCNDQAMKPCTEYRCKSLGIGCRYTEVEGRGRCVGLGVGDNTPPTIEFNPLVLSEGYQAVPVRLMEYEGVEIRPALAPKKNFTIGITTDEDAICALTPFPEGETLMIPSAITGLLPGGTTPEYQKDHNITIIPMAVDDAYKGILEATSLIGIDTILGFSDFLADYTARLEEFGEEYGVDTGPAVDAIEAALEEANMELINQTIRDIADKNYTIYIKCTDPAGNTNTEQFFIRATVAEAEPDTTAPQIINSSPEDGVIIFEDTFKMEIEIDDYTECRYDHRDVPFDFNQFRMKCPLTEYAITPSGTYKCNADVNMSTFAPYARVPIHIKCRNNPRILDKSTIFIKPSSRFAVDDDSEIVLNRILLEPPSSVTIVNPMMLKGYTKTIETDQPTVMLKLNVTDKECRFSTRDDLPFDQMIGMICTDQGCVQQVPAISFPYHIHCTDRPLMPQLETSHTIMVEKG